MVFILSQSDIYWESYDILEFLLYKKKYSSDGLNISQYCIILIRMVTKKYKYDV